jgi:hypothetical protein
MGTPGDGPQTNGPEAMSGGGDCSGRFWIDWVGDGLDWASSVRGALERYTPFRHASCSPRE